jgi:hypothetical protein
VVTVVVGSAAQTMTAEPGRVASAPAGALHLVDLGHPLKAAAATGSTFGYAACGAPVLLWPDAELAPEPETLLDPACAALAASSAPQRRESITPDRLRAGHGRRVRGRGVPAAARRR